MYVVKTYQLKKIIYKVPNINEKFYVPKLPVPREFNYPHKSSKNIIASRPIPGYAFVSTFELVRTSKHIRKAMGDLFKSNAFIFVMTNYFSKTNIGFEFYYAIKTYTTPFKVYVLETYRQTLGEGFFYLRGLFLILFIDAALTDDEPLWEPIEWSLVQTWIMFIFGFAWIAENLITSRYGSYTGRDKRVWFAWYKTFWLIEGWYVLSMGAAALFVIVPFYYELTYSMSFVVSWWNWYSRVFFFKFISMYTIILLMAYYLQINMRWFHWKKSFVIIVFINFFLAYLLYTHFIMSFFGYFTDSSWYKKTRFVDYVQLSHEPNKWSWGNAKRDHFTYHKVSTVFWFKNDGPFAAAFLFFHFMFFFFLFLLYLYWITLVRRVFATKELTYVYTTFCVSALKQFFYYFFMLYILVFVSFIICYWRFPIEFYWTLNSYSWFENVGQVFMEYPDLLKTLL